MTTDPDDALRWDGDETDAPSAPSTKAPPVAAEPDPVPATAEPDSAPAVAEPTPAPTAAESADAPDESADAPDEPAAIGNAALVFYGIIGGAYLLFAVGWIVGGFRLRPRASLLLVDWMYFPWMWLAVLAPVLWFAAAWVLTRGKAAWIRIVALVAGVALLVPWPFVMFGMVGS